MIYALFSIDNNYDQPDHNLVRFWEARPTLEQMAKAMGVSFPGTSDEQTLMVVNVWAGREDGPANGPLYWLATAQPDADLPVREHLRVTAERRKK